MSVVKNQRAIVTGAASGIGFQICRSLLKRGVAAVALLDIDTNGLHAAKAELSEEFGSDPYLITECVDITDEAKVRPNRLAPQRPRLFMFKENAC